MRPRLARRIARLYGGAALCGFFAPVNFQKMSGERMTYLSVEEPTKGVLLAIRTVDDGKENSAKYHFAYWNGSHFTTITRKKIKTCQSWQYIKNVSGGYFHENTI